VASFEGDLDNLTRKQVQYLLECLRKQIQVAKSLQEQETTTDRAS